MCTTRLVYSVYMLGAHKGYTAFLRTQRITSPLQLFAQCYIYIYVWIVNSSLSLKNITLLYFRSNDVIR